MAVRSIEWRYLLIEVPSEPLQIRMVTALPVQVKVSVIAE